PSGSRSSRETPMIRQPGMKPAAERWKSPGSSLRRDRSPVAPTRMTTCGYFGPTPGGIFFTGFSSFIMAATGGDHRPRRARSQLRLRAPGHDGFAAIGPGSAHGIESAGFAAGGRMEA